VSLRIEYDERAISQAVAFLGDPQGLREVLDAIDRLADDPHPAGGHRRRRRLRLVRRRIPPGQAAGIIAEPSADPARARDLAWFVAKASVLR
jgi:hypothetical protein